MTTQHHYINGQWIAGRGNPVTSTDPATGQTTWEGTGGSPGDIGLAVQAARTALDLWSRRTVEDRTAYLEAFGEKLQAQKQRIAETISRDTGKPLWESLGEASAMVAKIALSIQAYRDRRPTAAFDINGATAATRYKPHGVCAVFGPFNLPGHLPNGHIVPALLAGNTVVFKPSEQAAAVGQLTAQLWHEVGLPNGVVNVVQGGPDTGAALADHPDVDAIFFTGSSATGLRLAQRWSSTPSKVLALEMGGNNPLVVWDAADLDAAAYLTIQSAYITAGQRCTCARRLIISQDDHGHALIATLQRYIIGVRVGGWSEHPEPFMGPMISAPAAQRVLDAQQQLIHDGADPIVLAERPHEQRPALLTPGLLDVTAIKDRTDNEVFGPLLQIIRVGDFDSAIREANRTAYGLSAALLSDDRDLYQRFVQQVRAGVVNWNQQTTGASGKLPFGGVGASGNHHPSGYWAADYCSYPVATIEQPKLAPPKNKPPGIDTPS